MIHREAMWSGGHYLVRLLLFGFISVALMAVFGARRVHAITDNNYGDIPSGIVTSTDMWCHDGDGNTFGAAQDLWISSGSSSAQTTITINEHTSSVALRYNVLSRHCDSELTPQNSSGSVTDLGKNLLETKSRITGASLAYFLPGQAGVTPTLGSIVGDQVVLDYNHSNVSNDRYIRDSNGDIAHLDFTLDNISALKPGVYKFKVDLTTIDINHFQMGDYAPWQCINGSREKATDFDGTNTYTNFWDASPKNPKKTCPPAGASTEFQLVVKEVDDPPSGSATITCDTITGSAIDPDGSPIDVHIYIDGIGFVSPDNADPDFSFTFPQDFKDGFSRKVQVYAINRPPPGLAATAGNTLIADVTLPRCRPPTCEKPTTFGPGGTNPEIGNEFGVRAGHTYVAGQYVRAFQFNVGIKIAQSDHPTLITSQNYWSAVGSGGSVPRSSFGEVNPPYKVMTEGSYTINYDLNYWGHGESYVVHCTEDKGTNALKISRIPYFKIYGNDAMAGGVFGSGATCSGTPANSSATFRGYNKAGPLPSSDPNYGFYRGAGAQFGLYALDIIREVPSLGMADTAIRALSNPRSQTFANWDVTATAFVSDYGGRSKLTRACIPDYFNASSGKVFQNNPGSITPLGDTTGGTTFTYINGNITINGQPNFAGKQTIFVNGNARLANSANIKYVPFTNSSNAPNFTLIVKGNIYIDNGTSQLDGTYIAQPLDPADTTKGQIVSCYYADSGPVPVQNMANPPQPVNGGCNNKLTVNGALIARQIKLLRTNGSLSNGIAPVSDPPNFSWSYFDVTTDPNRHCITTREPSLSGSPTSGRQSVWYDNWLCARNGLDIEWVNNGAYGLGGLKTAEQPGFVYTPQGTSRNKTVTIGGVQKECVLFYEPSMLNTQTSWNDNWLCMNQSNDYDLKFYHGGSDSKPSSNPGTCIAIWEPSDSWPASYQSPVDGSWQPPSPYSGTWHDNWLCVVNTYVTSSEPEASSSDNISEVLNFSPEVYLNPADYQPAAPSKKRYDSIQTLPPIF